MGDNPWAIGPTTSLDTDGSGMGTTNYGVANLSPDTASELSKPFQSTPTAPNASANTGTGMAIGAGLGILSALGASNARKYQGLAAAAQTRWSPWTKLGLGQMPGPSNAMGSIAGLTAAGGTLAQGLQGGNLANLYKPTVGYGTGGSNGNGS